VDALSSAHDRLGLEGAPRDEVLRQLVLARMIEPTSESDSLRALAEVGVARGEKPEVRHAD